VIRDLIFTPVSHSSTINVLRLVFDQPSHGINELTMRKYRDVVGRMLCKLIQERLSSKYEGQKRLGARPIRELGV
jgi:hypothetical protein